MKGINKGKKNGQYKHGKYCQDYNNICSCGKIIKNANAKMCRKCYIENIMKVSINAPHYKHGLPKCIDCGKQLNRYNSKRCKLCANKLNGLKKFGKNNPAYIHGEGYDEYTSEFNKHLKLQIRKRDNFECQHCHITEEEHISVLGKALAIHHIDYDRKNCSEENLITLCNQCNLRANFNRKYWINDFKNIIGRLYQCLKNI